MSLHCLLHDLKDDPTLIEAYERHHQRVWPEVVAHLRANGVLRMQIYRLGTRLVMLMTTDDAIYTPEKMAQASLSNPKIREWEALMDRFQAPTPWTPQGHKWVTAQPIFELPQQQAA